MTFILDNVDVIAEDAMFPCALGKNKIAGYAYFDSFFNIVHRIASNNVMLNARVAVAYHRESDTSSRNGAFYVG